ncbi:hypothetical protein HS7_17750 [Sulfolobales archaeon HS-7]|nr:hypothetical protein HS7_17750 [Sulfolobales archaeon HS-7]
MVEIKVIHGLGSGAEAVSTMYQLKSELENSIGGIYIETESDLLVNDEVYLEVDGHVLNFTEDLNKLKERILSVVSGKEKEDEAILPIRYGFKRPSFDNLSVVF